ncbi:unnamed protein product [Clonostachys solani]|uniref:RlpA-like protein double-psi beta-barrel domain-containing protein n=1 Tax=Clonostachys solani TaxID=160281 RepID=A0A9P0EEB7_9HYPO|nr:unnamed protein product [Clonostachys solani]
MVAITKILLATLSSSLVIAREGKMTWYNPGLGACGKTNNGNDIIVAIGVPHWHAANPNKDANCQKKVTIHYGGKKVTARVVDKCMSCGRNNIDVSPAVFKKFGPLSKGHYQVKWNLHN